MVYNRPKTMRKTLRLFVAAFFVTAMMQTVASAQTAFASMAPTGQMLWYYPYDNTVDSVYVIAPSGTNWGYYQKPVGNLVIPDSVERSGVTYYVKGILSYAFKDCNELRSVVVSDGIEMLGISSFSGCSGMTDITLGASTWLIYDSTFFGCSSLQWIKAKASICMLLGGDATFAGVNNSIPVYVPCNYSIMYSALWTYFSNFVESVLYTVNTASEPYSFLGEVEVSGTPTCESPYVTLTATPSISGYHFVSWNDGNTDNPREVELTSDTSFVATFAYGSSTGYTITVVSANPEMGTVTGSGTFDAYTNTTITATANPGYRFVQWQDGNTQNIRTIYVTSDKTYTAYFQSLEGVESIENSSFDAYSTGKNIIVMGVQGENVTVVDMMGRIIASCTAESDHIEFQTPTSGVYMLSVGNRPAVKILVK